MRRVTPDRPAIRLSSGRHDCSRGLSSTSCIHFRSSPRAAPPTPARNSSSARPPKIDHQSVARPSAKCTAGTVTWSHAPFDAGSKNLHAFSSDTYRRKRQSVARSSADAFAPGSSHSVENRTPLVLVDRPALVVAGGRVDAESAPDATTSLEPHPPGDTHLDLRPSLPSRMPCRRERGCSGRNSQQDPRRR